MLKLIKINNSRMNVPEVEYYVANDEINNGELVIFDGNGIKRSKKTEEMPNGVAMSSGVAGEKIAVCLLDSSQVWEVDTWVSLKDNLQINLGTHVSLYSDKVYSAGEQAVVVDISNHRMDGSQSFGTVRIKFLCNN